MCQKEKKPACRVFRVFRTKFAQQCVSNLEQNNDDFMKLCFYEQIQWSPGAWRGVSGQVEPSPFT